MAVNTHFHTSGVASSSTEQNLYADLIAEAIQIYGHDVHYLSKTLVAEDTVLGEDALIQYTKQAKIEMYIEDSEGGFQGEKELMSKFGLQELSEITFIVSKTRFQDLTKQITIESGTDTLSGSIVMEAGTDTSIESGYIIGEATSTDADRPLEGDVIYHPTIAKLFQINFVDHDEPFYQLDNTPIYKLRCRTFDYGQQALDTDITAIDAVETDLSEDILTYQFTQEQTSTYNENISLENNDGNSGMLILDASASGTDEGENLLGEEETGNGAIEIENPADVGIAEYIIQESYILGDMSVDKTAQNELFDSLDDSVLDFTEKNPFGEVGSS
tara:strand:+ start:995 stop:1984 length:990 start_codon:yes stop_codon:yes gene_type:complete